jgi:hypothetical protein
MCQSMMGTLMCGPVQQQALASIQVHTWTVVWVQMVVTETQVHTWTVFQVQMDVGKEYIQPW